ncbi:MAG: GNAT family N-acetyltransferase, partial [Chloroflexi bacterium]|nr:GNAT family N-acetyltransferase [Chloroflexota bacterium]
LIGLYGDSEVMRYISGGRPFSRDRVSSMLEHALCQWRERGFGPWAVIDKVNGAWIGEVGLNEIPDWPDEYKVEVGWELHRAWWGRGIAPEGGLAALWFGFATHHLERIISVTRPENAPSRRVMEKIGLVCYGTRPYRDGMAVCYALDRTTWETAHDARSDASYIITHNL